MDTLTVSTISYHLVTLVKSTKSRAKTSRNPINSVPNKVLPKLNFIFCALCLLTAIMWTIANSIDCLVNVNFTIGQIASSLYGAQYILLLFILFYRICIVFDNSAYAIS